MATRPELRRIARALASSAGAASLALVALATSSCAPRPEGAPRRDSVLAGVGSAPARPSPRDSSPATVSAPATPLNRTVSERGIGPLRIGMTFAEASAALNGTLLVPVGVDTTGCDYLVWDGGPPGVHVMFDAHHIARVDIDTASIATAAGARIGDDEARIKRLYPGQVTVTPHKYVDGHYLTVTPSAPADKQYRIVFETVGGRVARYRAGIMPSVEYVEGCS